MLFALWVTVNTQRGFLFSNTNSEVSFVRFK